MCMKLRNCLHLLIVLVLCATLSCQRKNGQSAVSKAESREAKQLLQGVWLDAESEEVSFRAKGDTLYYPDPAMLPAAFRIVDDSLHIGSRSYHIVKQAEHLFWFVNQNGDVVKLVKSSNPADLQAFQHRKLEVLSVQQVLKSDSVVMFGGERYHWYIAVNPTKYRVTKTTYTDDGVGVENVYYDNIIHISLFQGARQLFSRDFKKRDYEAYVPSSFLSQAVLGNMQYDGVDDSGFRFNATLCIPDEASCYLVGTTISRDGKLTLKLLEY